MLVLSRKVGEAITIPDCRVVLTVLEVWGNRVRLGIAAPPEVRISRQEIVGRQPAGPSPPGRSLPQDGAGP